MSEQVEPVNFCPPWRLVQNAAEDDSTSSPALQLLREVQANAPAFLAARAGGEDSRVEDDDGYYTNMQDGGIKDGGEDAASGLAGRDV